MTHTLTVAAMLTLLVASYVLLAWIARHPQVFTATARDARDLAAALAAWPGRFRRGLTYRRRRFEHENCHARPRRTTTLPALTAARTA